MAERTPQIQESLDKLIALCEQILEAVGKADPVVKEPVVKGAKK